MGTRGLYGFIQEEKYTGNYNNYDSYPEGLGVGFYLACQSNDFSKHPMIEDEIGFIRDSLFCEWAYFYDKDKKIFEIWKGFQKIPDPDNPFGQERSEDGYYPCKRIFRGSINDISELTFDHDNIDLILKSIERDKKIISILDDRKTNT
jgi:hypothetical protein